MTIELFGTGLSPPFKAVLYTAKELGLDVKITNINLGAGDHLKPEFLKVRIPLSNYACFPDVPLFDA